MWCEPRAVLLLLLLLHQLRLRRLSLLLSLLPVLQTGAQCPEWLVRL